jgi:hypothetical protein
LELLVNTVRSFLALPLLVRWMLAGALLPSAFWAAVALLGVFTVGLGGTVQALGYVLVLLVVLGVPGAMAGLVLGLLDRWSTRRVQEADGSRASVARATVFMAVPLVGVSTLIQVYLSYGIGILAAVVSGAVLISVPVLVCYLRYRRVAVRASAAAGRTATVPGSADLSR